MSRLVLCFFFSSSVPVVPRHLQPQTAPIHTYPSTHRDGAVFIPIYRPVDPEMTRVFSTCVASSTSGAVVPSLPLLTMQEMTKIRFTAGTAFLTGWADIFFYYHFKTFATMLTGNTLWASLAVAEKRIIDALYYISVIASYMIGIGVFQCVNIRYRRQSMRICAAIIPVLFALGDVAISVATPNRRLWIPVLIFSNAFGIINSVATEFSGTLTNVTTGHLTKLTTLIVKYFRQGTVGQNKSSTFSVYQNISVVMGFCGGATFAGSMLKRGLLTGIGTFTTIGVCYSGLFLWKA
mmetsp:Transcript_9047/g.20009  ORF Transcript_9047/g.20009 Transcript_9047/m.20009 type:complete len:293 (-) Transcript_9047:361-1239(-)